MRRTPRSRLAKIVFVVLVGGFITSCGSRSSTSSNSETPATGTLITLVTDVPICSAISANVVVDNLSFSLAEGGAPAPYLTTTPSFAPEIKVNLEQLRDFDTILYEYPVRGGTYTQANLGLELAQLSAYNPAMSPPNQIFSVTLTNTKPIFNLSPPIVITPGQTNVIVMDFDVLNMLQVNSTGNLTGAIIPQATFTQLTSILPNGTINPNGFTELDDLWGFVRSISNTNTTSNPTYIGNFQMQLLSPSTANAPEVAINLTNNTTKIGFADLGHLLPDSYVEVDAILDYQGNLAAKTVEVQAVEDPFPTQSGVTPSTALIGPITNIQTDTAGNPTKLNLWVRDAEPDNPSVLSMDQIYSVDLTANPTYQASVMGPNFANLSFGPQNLAVGQELVVHGAYTKGTTTSGTSSLAYSVEPTEIYLRLQSIQGTMTSMLTIGSDDETGVFVLNPCCVLLNGAPIYVVTNNQTAYVNVTGLDAISTVNGLLVKGMPYYEPQATHINGVTIPAGSLVVQAKQVHVLP